MTQMDTKNQSVLPYALGGAAVGGLGGYGVSNIEALKKPKYNSWQEVLKDSKDILELENKDSLKEAQKEAVEAVKEAKDTYKETIKSIARNKENISLSNKVESEREALKNASKELKSKFDEIVDDMIKNDGAHEFKHNGKTGKELEQEARKYARKLLDNSEIASNNSKVKELQTAFEKTKTASTELKDACKKHGVKNKEFTEAGRNAIKEAQDTAWNAVKDKMGCFKAPRTWLCVGIGAGAGLLLGALLKPKAKAE